MNRSFVEWSEEQNFCLEKKGLSSGFKQRFNQKEKKIVYFCLLEPTRKKYSVEKK